MLHETKFPTDIDNQFSSKVGLNNKSNLPNSLSLDQLLLAMHVTDINMTGEQNANLYDDSGRTFLVHYSVS